MTARDYRLLADALLRARHLCETDNQRRGVERAALCVAEVLKLDNARFDRSRFLRAVSGQGAEDRPRASDYR